MEPFLGQLKLFAGNFAPVGWVLCDGRLLAIAENDALYSLIGDAFGGDGATTFAVPDLRGRVPMGFGTDSAGNVVNVGNKGGAENVTLTANNLPPHTHPFVASTQNGNTNRPTGQLLGKQPDGALLFRNVAPTGTMGAAIQPSTGGPHENRQPYIVVNYIMATEGIFPPQS